MDSRLIKNKYGNKHKFIINLNKDVFLNSHIWFSFFYSTFLFGYEIRFVRDIISIIHPVFIIWASILIVYDIVVLQLWRTVPFYKVLVLFAIGTLVTALLNYHVGVVGNVKAWILSILPLFIVYPVCFLVNKRRKKNFIIAMLGAEIVISISSIISVCMFLLRYGKEVELWKQRMLVGIYEAGTEDATYSILQGVYYDSGHAATYAMVSVFFSCILFEYCKKGIVENKIWNSIGKIFSVLNILIQICYFTLANSRGGWVSFIVALFVGIYLFCFFKKLHIDQKLFLFLGALLIAIFSVIFLFFSLLCIRNGMSHISYVIDGWRGNIVNSQNINESGDNELEKKQGGSDIADSQNDKESLYNQDQPLEGISKQIENPQDVQKELPIISNEQLQKTDSFERPEETGDEIGSGRIGIWREAIQLYMKRPVFGECPGNNAYYADKYNVQGILKNGKAIHNSYLDLLVDYGIVCFLILFCFYMLCAHKILLKLIIEGRDCDASFFYAIAGIVMTMCASFFLSCIFINTTAMYFLNLLFLGYLVSESSLKIEK